uniref:Uncharacterized protein n=1 Tax=Rhizophora mucronata TaxID=61149 RepID=A0A2P2PBC6_RHIMU
MFKYFPFSIIATHLKQKVVQLCCVSVVFLWRKTCLAMHISFGHVSVSLSGYLYA